MTDVKKNLVDAINRYLDATNPVLDQLERMIANDLAKLTEEERQEILREIARDNGSE